MLLNDKGLIKFVTYSFGNAQQMHSGMKKVHTCQINDCKTTHYLTKYIYKEHAEPHSGNTALHTSVCVEVIAVVYNKNRFIIQSQ